LEAAARSKRRRRKTIGLFYEALVELIIGSFLFPWSLKELLIEDEDAPPRSRKRGLASGLAGGASLPQVIGTQACIKLSPLATAFVR
jgi:hypothetical protein